MTSNQSSSAAQGDKPYGTIVAVVLIILLGMTYFLRDRHPAYSGQAAEGFDPYSDSENPITEEDWIELEPKLAGNARTAWHPHYGTVPASIGASKVAAGQTCQRTANGPLASVAKNPCPSSGN